jgi:SpoVK/Ycf46/Vps4 family AAA+-type ATPase
LNLIRPGRLDKLLYVPLPDENERFDILSTILKKCPVADDLDIEEIAKNSYLEGYILII